MTIFPSPKFFKSCYFVGFFQSQKDDFTIVFFLPFLLRSKKIVPWIKMHLLDLYSVWHEIAVYDIAEEAGGMEY